jgi:hypothetical protein
MEFYVGQTLKLLLNFGGYYVGGYYNHVVLANGTEVVVKNVYNDSIWIRGVTTGGPERTLVFPLSGTDPEEYFEDTNPAAPVGRKLGEVPEGGIAPDDPRLAWLWEDAGKLATRQGHCGDYDKMCDALGIPGRERSFTVKRKVNGFDISKKFTARSRKLAEEMFDAELEKALS